MSCHLLRLPQELRDLIYEHLYQDEASHCNLHVAGQRTHFELANFRIQGKTGSGLHAWGSSMSRSTTLLRACKQLRHEATPFFENSIVYNITVHGKSPGLIGSVLSKREFHNLVTKMRRVTLTQKVTHWPPGVISSAPRLSDLEEVFSSLKRNTNVLVEMLQCNDRLRVGLIDLDFSFHGLCECGDADNAVVLLEALDSSCTRGVKVRNISRSAKAITDGCLSRLAKALEGIACTGTRPGEI